MQAFALAIFYTDSDATFVHRYKQMCTRVHACARGHRRVHLPMRLLIWLELMRWYCQGLCEMSLIL